jgi:hypothetical protein
VGRQESREGTIEDEHAEFGEDRPWRRSWREAAVPGHAQTEKQWARGTTITIGSGKLQQAKIGIELLDDILRGVFDKGAIGRRISKVVVRR